MTNITRHMRTIDGKGILQVEEGSETTVFYRIDVFQTFIISGNNEIPGLKNLEIAIELTKSDISKVISFMNGKNAQLKFENGDVLTIVPYKTTIQGVLAKLAPGNSEQVLARFD